MTNHPLADDMPGRERPWPGRAGTPALRCLLVAGMCSLVLGCRSYRFGSVAHPQIRTVAVGMFENATTEPRLSSLLRSSIAEHLLGDSSVRVVPSERADVTLEGRILTCASRGVAAAKTRSDRARDRDSDAYQTVIYRAEVGVEFRVVMAGRPEPVLDARQAQGAADYSPLPDVHTARDDALRQAVSDAAKQIVDAVLEAW